MPFQPINFANIAPIGKPWARNFADNLKQGMEMGALPQRLLREQQQEALANALKQNELNYAPRMSEENLTKIRQENEWNPKINAANVANTGANTAHTNMQTQWMPQLNQSLIANQGANTAHTNLQTKLMPGTTAAENAYKYASAQALGRPQTDMGQMVNDHQNIIKKHGAGSAPDLMFRGLMQQAQAKSAMTGASETEKAFQSIRDREDLLKNQNLSPEERQRVGGELAILKSREIQKTVPAAMWPQLQAGSVMQTLMDDINIKDATRYSGIIAKKQKGIDRAAGNENWRKYEDAENKMESLATNVRAFTKGSVTSKEMNRLLKFLDGNRLSLSPAEAEKLMKSAFSTLTKEHIKYVNNAGNLSDLLVPAQNKYAAPPAPASQSRPGASPGTAANPQMVNNYNQPPIVVPYGGKK